MAYDPGGRRPITDWNPNDKNAWLDSNYESGAKAPANAEAISSMRRSPDGQYICAPRGMDTPEKVDKAIEDYVRKAVVGQKGRSWYEDSKLAKAQGLEQNPNVVKLREAILEGSKRPEGAMAYIQDLMKKGILPAAVVAPLLENLMSEGD